MTTNNEKQIAISKTANNKKIVCGYKLKKKYEKFNKLVRTAKATWSPCQKS